MDKAGWIGWGVAGVLLVGCGTLPDGRESSSAARVRASMQRHAERFLEDEAFHALSIGVWLDGSVYTEHFGELDPGQGNSPNDGTRYEPASVSKTFAGLLVAAVLEEGRFRLEDEVRTHLGGSWPNLEAGSEPLRWLHLVTHTSGLPRNLPAREARLFRALDGDELVFALDQVRTSYTKDDFLSDLTGVTPAFTPGTRHEYSNANTELVAYLLERVRGRPYEAQLAELCRELGLDDTRLAQTAANGSLATGRATSACRLGLPLDFPAVSPPRAPPEFSLPF